MNALAKNNEILEEKSFIKFVENFVAPERSKPKHSLRENENFQTIVTAQESRRKA